MKPGGGKAKGAQFERSICVALSRWVTHGKRGDVFWRSAMSGGRATVRNKRNDKGEIDVRQAGDVSSVAPEGHVLTDRFYIELKHRRDLRWESFLLFDTGLLAEYWARTVYEANLHGRTPILIAKQNMVPILIVTVQVPRGPFSMTPVLARSMATATPCTVLDFDAVMRTKFFARALAL